MTNLEKRVHNLEEALISLAAIAAEGATPENAELIVGVMKEFIEASHMPPSLRGPTFATLEHEL